MIRMTLCPNCRTIQKHNSTCAICKCPVRDPEPEDGQHPERASVSSTRPNVGLRMYVK
jgi:hypothetical protein